MGDVQPFFQQREDSTHEVRRCGAHEPLVREITLVGAAVLQLGKDLDNNNEKTLEAHRALSDRLAAIQKSLDNIDPEATKARLTYNGVIISAGVSVVVAIIAHSDKLAALWKAYNG